jgi:hypothetical protein
MPTSSGVDVGKGCAASAARLVLSDKQVKQFKMFMGPPRDLLATAIIILSSMRFVGRRPVRR